MEIDKLLDRLWKTLEAIQVQIRAYDTKAQIVIGIDGIVAAFLGAQSANLAKSTAAYRPACSATLLWMAAISSLAALACSLYYAIRTVYPMEEFSQPSSLLFFGHITKRFGTDFSAGREAFAVLADESLRDDISGQIIAVAHICDKKAGRVHKALAAMAVGLGLWTATLTLQFWVEHHIALKQAQLPSATVSGGSGIH